MSTLLLPAANTLNSQKMHPVQAPIRVSPFAFHHADFAFGFWVLLMHTLSRTGNDATGVLRLVSEVC